MNFHTIEHNPKMGVPPGARQRVELCYDIAKTTCWLQLFNNNSIIRGDGKSFVTCLIGATRTKFGWEAITVATANRFRQKSEAFGCDLVDAAMGDKIALFQKKIIDDWWSFHGDMLRAHKWAKGLTYGVDYSSPSFVMKAIKTGFEALGVSVATYEGKRSEGYTVDDAIGYLRKRAAMVSSPIVDTGLLDFERLPPAPFLDREEDKESREDGRQLAYVDADPGKTHSRRFAYSSGSHEHIKAPFEQVIAYAFRGDKRPPSEVRMAGGFLPNATRTDHLEKIEKASPADKRDADEATLDLESFVANEFLGGYISTSKSYAVAKHFVKTGGGGWIYVCFVEGGYLLPEKGWFDKALKKVKPFEPPSDTDQPWKPSFSEKSQWFKVKYNEQEIAMPGMLEWADVVACRACDANGKFQGDIFMSKALWNKNSDAAMTIYRLLSGKSQGPGLPP